MSPKPITASRISRLLLSDGSPVEIELAPGRFGAPICRRHRRFTERRQLLFPNALGHRDRRPQPWQPFGQFGGLDVSYCRRSRCAERTRLQGLLPGECKTTTDLGRWQLCLDQTGKPEVIPEEPIRAFISGWPTIRPERHLSLPPTTFVDCMPVFRVRCTKGSRTFAESFKEGNT